MVLIFCPHCFSLTCSKFFLTFRLFVRMFVTHCVAEFFQRCCWHCWLLSCVVASWPVGLRLIGMWKPGNSSSTNCSHNEELGNVAEKARFEASSVWGKNLEHFFCNYRRSYMATCTNCGTNQIRVRVESSRAELML